AQPPGMNGMIVTVSMNDRHAPAAPRTPRLLFQYPRGISAPNNHSEAPRNQRAPRMPNTGYIQKMRGPLLMYGINVYASYSNHFWYPKNAKMITIDARIRW